jgi:hypothetical protein
MGTADIITKIQLALKKCSEESSIDKKDIRIKLSITKGFIKDEVRLTLMKNTDYLHDLDIKPLLGINALEVMIVNTFLCNTLSKFSKELNVSEKDIDARIYTRSDDFTPLVYLYSDNNPIRPITMEELMS